MIKGSPNGQATAGQAGFSLVEVCLALMVIAIGLLVLMALFPSGLKEMERATENTRTSLFADDKLNGYQANALLLESIPEFKNHIFVFGDNNTNLLVTVKANGSTLRWKYFTQLNTAVPSTPVWRVRLELKNGADGPFADPVVFYTELVYGAPRP
jgi:prepilin-type N-terminal cleavage/methylation domain-containing protein